MSAVAAGFASHEAATSRRGTLRRAFWIAAGSVLFGALAGMIAVGGHAVDAIGLVAIFLPIAIWLRPQLGPIVLLLTGLLIEGFPLGLTNGSAVVNAPITNSIPMFHGLGSVHVQPADLLPIVIFVIYMIRSADAGARWWPKTQLSLAMLAVVGAMVFGEVYGLAHHGSMRESMFECRPLVYLSLSYLLTSVMLRTRGALKTVLWSVVGAEIFKSLQAIYIWRVTSSWDPKPQNVLGHEEAMFETLFFLIVIALWLFDVRGRLRTVATRSVPLVMFADMINDRRLAWLMLAVALVTMVAIGYKVLPHRRRMLGRAILVTLFVSAIYLPAYWNHTGGTLGKPADAVRSAFSPNPRDALSNEYRVDEDANLQFNIKQNGILGAGYGIPIDYALPMPGLVTAGDSGIGYVPHNSVLYEVMRLGLLGATAFWALLGAAIIAGCRLARCPDRLLAAIGAVGASVVVAWALEGAEDMGFTFPRVAIVMGCVLGLLEAARRLNSASRGAPGTVNAAGHQSARRPGARPSAAAAPGRAPRRQSGRSGGAAGSGGPLGSSAPLGAQRESRKNPSGHLVDLSTRHSAFDQ